MNQKSARTLKECSSNLSIALSAIGGALSDPDNPELEVVLQLARDRFTNPIAVRSSDAIEDKSIWSVLHGNKTALSRAGRRAKFKANPAGSEHHEAHRLCNNFLNGLLPVADVATAREFNNAVKGTRLCDGESLTAELAEKMTRTAFGPTLGGYVFKDDALKKSLPKVRKWLRDHANLAADCSRLLGRIKAELEHVKGVHSIGNAQQLKSGGGKSARIGGIVRTVIDDICDELDGQALKLFKFLVGRMHKTTFDSLVNDSTAFAGEHPTRASITRALRRLNEKLEAIGAKGYMAEWDLSEERAWLIRPK